MIHGVRFGRKFADATFDTFEVSRFNEKAVDACQSLVRSEIGGVVLIGPGGVGKTHLLHALAVEFDRLRFASPTGKKSADEPLGVPSASELIRNADRESAENSATPTLTPEEAAREAVIVYWPMLDLVGSLRIAARLGDTDISEECCTCDLLILDDLGHEKTSEFIVQEFRRIIDWRYREILPTAIATNLTKSDLLEKYEEHTYSRWLGSCEIVEIAGSDYRMDRGPRGG
jgi:DNA replication protein DnaC